MTKHIIAAIVLTGMLALMDIGAHAQNNAIREKVMTPSPQSTTPTPTHAFTPPVATDANRIAFLQAEIDVLLTKNEELRGTIEANQKACNNRVATGKFYGVVDRIFRDANADQATWDWDAATLQFNQKSNPTPPVPAPSPTTPNAK